MKKLKKIKILYLTTTSCLFGAETMILELASGLDKERYEVMVCTIKDDLSEQLLNKLRDKDIKTESLELTKKWQIWKVFKLFRLINKFKPDILHTHLFHANLIGRIFNLLSGKKAVVISTNHNVDIGKTREMILKSTDFLNNRTVAVGEKVLERSVRITSPEKICLIYNGINFKNLNDKAAKQNTREMLGFISEQKIILSVGRLCKQKGYPFLINAFFPIVKNNPRATLIILGEGEARKKLQSLIKKLGIENNVVLMGRVENVPDYLQAADLFIMSSLWEGFSVVLLEAGYLGLPVIATNVGGNSEIVKDGKTGFLIEPQNEQAITKAIMNFFMLSEEEKQTMGKNIKSLVTEKFSAKKMIKEHEKLYEKLSRK